MSYCEHRAECSSMWYTDLVAFQRINLKLWSWNSPNRYAQRQLHPSKLMYMYACMMLTAHTDTVFTACQQPLRRAAQLWPQCKWDLRDSWKRGNRITVRSHYATQVLEFSCNPIMLGENPKQHNSFSKVSWDMVPRSFVNRYWGLLLNCCVHLVPWGWRQEGHGNLIFNIWLPFVTSGSVQLCLSGE